MSSSCTEFEVIFPATVFAFDALEVTLATFAGLILGIIIALICSKCFFRELAKERVRKWTPVVINHSVTTIEPLKCPEILFCHVNEVISAVWSFCRPRCRFVFKYFMFFTASRCLISSIKIKLHWLQICTKSLIVCFTWSFKSTKNSILPPKNDIR